MKRLLQLALLLALLGWCAAASAQTPVNGNASNTGTATCSFTLAVTTGADRAVLAVGTTTSVPSTTTISIADTNITWTAITGSPWLDSGTKAKTYAWLGTSIVATQTDTITFTISNTTNTGSCAAEQYSGLAASPVDKIAQASNETVNSGVTQTTGTTATTTQANEMLVGIFSDLSTPAESAAPGAVWTASGGYTAEQQSSASFNTANINSTTLIEDLAVTATGAYSATASNNKTTSSGNAIIVTLKSSNAGGATPPQRSLTGIGK